MAGLYLFLDAPKQRALYCIKQEKKMMKSVAVMCVMMCVLCIKTNAQKIDSIYFHLYTDSLKKGVYNYINVDGLLSNGRWMPLDTTQIQFLSSDGTWKGNNLMFEPSFNKEFVTVTAVLKSNRALQRSVVIYLKKRPDDEKLPTEAEILNNLKNNSKRRKGKEN